MKHRKITAVLFAAALALSGCSGSPETTTTTAASETTTTPTEVTSEEPIEEQIAPEEVESTVTEDDELDLSALDPDSDEYRAEIVNRSLLTAGNTSRMKSVLSRAQNGEEITAAYIGGSITEGLTAGADKCWARLSYEWLCDRLPEAKINFVNAGMSGTPSTLGAIRVERDVIEPYGDPDIVFIEFAVNDGQDALSQNAYESLVRRMLSLKEDTAVVLLFTVLKNGYSCETAHMKPIGEYYGLPMISVGTALNEEFESGRTPWEKYSDDESHPNEWGHVLVKDFVANYFETVLAAPDEKAAEIPAGPLYGADYTNLHLLDRTNLTPVSIGEYDGETATITQFPNGWTRKRAENKGIEFEITCKDLFVIYHCNKPKTYGTADVYIDGELSASVNSSDEAGWSNPVAQLIYSGTEVKTHTVSFKMAEGHEESYFGILGFGYSD